MSCWGARWLLRAGSLLAQSLKVTPLTPAAGTWWAVSTLASICPSTPGNIQRNFQAKAHHVCTVLLRRCPHFLFFSYLTLDTLWQCEVRRVIFILPSHMSCSSSKAQRVKSFLQRHPAWQVAAGPHSLPARSPVPCHPLRDAVGPLVPLTCAPEVPL